MDYWIFTFGFSRDIYGDKAGTAVKVYADSYEEAREKMCKKYGTRWVFQYSEKEWSENESNANRYWDMEPIMEEII